MSIFYMPVKVYEETNAIQNHAKEIAAFGKKALIVTGRRSAFANGSYADLTAALEQEGVSFAVYSEVEENPSVHTIIKARDFGIAEKVDFVIGIGGGSPLDVAKAVAVLGSYGGKITDYEGVGKVTGPVIPMIAIPTTAGTGSEVTSFSVITDHSRNYKLTVGSTYLLSKYVILDPELITTVPLKTSAYCGVDALVHALEAYISLASSPFSDIMALQALELIGSNIRSYVADRKDRQAAEGMLLGSLFAGIAFSHARLGDVHAMSHPVSAFFDVAHGLANAVLLPTVVRFNAQTDTGKYYEIYRRISLDPVSKEIFKSEMLAEELRFLNSSLGIPDSLKEVGVDSSKFEEMAEDAMKSGNIAVNPRITTKTDILLMYSEAY